MSFLKKCISAVLAGITCLCFSAGVFAENPIEPPVIKCTRRIVTITAQEGATIYYTTDGTTPDENSEEYTKAFAIADDTVVKAIAVTADGTSDIAERTLPSPLGDDDPDGWAEIDELLEDVSNHSTITVEAEKNTVIPERILDKIKGRDITLVIKVADGMKWTVNGKNVEYARDTDLYITTGEYIPKSVIDAVDGAKTTQLHLTNDGDFGFKATLSLSVDRENNGKYANLYSYNSTTKELEFRAASLVESGKTTFDFDHAADYALVIDEKSHADLSDLAAGEGVSVNEIML